MNVKKVLDNFRRIAPTKREKGKLFEKFAREYLRLAPEFKPFAFRSVVLWNDWEYRDGADSGIDLVAETGDGRFWAIQCKFYDSGEISKTDVDSFIAAATRIYTNSEKKQVRFDRLVVFGTVPLSTTAAKTLKHRETPGLYIDATTLDGVGVDWDRFWDEFDSKFVSDELGPLFSRVDDAISFDVLQAKKELRAHQRAALEATKDGFQAFDRGKLIMACGTGKTLTSLRIVEELTPKSGRALYLVPSLSLLAQTLREWSIDAKRNLTPLIVCSDAEIHEQDARRVKAFATDDREQFDAIGLASPATTDPAILKERLVRLGKTDASNAAPSLFDKFDKKEPGDSLVVVFSTYQSIQVIADAQDKHGFPEFDIIVCDEAHRTTGVSIGSQDESAFVKVHDANVIRGAKRLYMTATPRVFGEAIKRKAKENADAELCSMDDESKYGPEFFKFGFKEAVDQGLLCDYKVAILCVDENDAAIKGLTLNEESEFDVDEVAKLIGCWRGLAKVSKYRDANGVVKNDFASDPEPMKRAVAFCRDIARSKKFADNYESILREALGEEYDRLSVKVEHIDGTFGASKRKERLDWLKEEPEPGTCRVLSNVRCLSEGVDVPSLDAAIFLSPRNSQVDVIQSVGRVMRRAEGKKHGYIILPVVIPSNVEVEKALDDNERFKIVWQVLQALRSHDENFRVEVNQLQFDKRSSDKIAIIAATGNGENVGGSSDNPRQQTFDFVYDDIIGRAVCAKIAKKCGDRDYLDEWARRVAVIAASRVGAIRETLERMREDSKQSKAWIKLRTSLQKELNPNLGDVEILKMITEHIAMKPVFDAIFGDNEFVQKNPISKAIQRVLKAFEEARSHEEILEMESFERAVKRNVEGVRTSSGKNEVVLKLYENFIREASKKDAERLGIVYTPQPVVDFILRSADAVLRREFGRGISGRNVHVLDPFTGTGNFIARALQLDLIEPSDLKRKFEKEFHANEIVLLAYYVAAVKIEETFREVCEQTTGEPQGYRAFKNIVLCDTFRQTEADASEIYSLLPQEDEDTNAKRLWRQKNTRVEVVIGNPPYSGGQKSANDNNQNQKYERLDRRIAETYAAFSTANLKNSLYDSYFKAFRWASDRIGESGVVAFVTNGSYIDASVADGFRKTLSEEFTTIYIVNLRGDRRTQGETSRKEGGPTFGSSSRAPVAISVLVRNPANANARKIYYWEVGDYWKREEKLDALKALRDVGTMMDKGLWTEIVPNAKYDWINQRGNEFEKMFVLGDKKDNDGTVTFFEDVYSRGVMTGRDAWCYNCSTEKLLVNIKRFIQFFNEQVDEYSSERGCILPREFACQDKTKISWSDNLFSALEKGQRYDEAEVDSKRIRTSIYRPYCKSKLFFDRFVNDRVLQIPKSFPTARATNRVICVPGPGNKKEFSCLIVNEIPCNDMIEKTQCFPLYYYEPVESSSIIPADTEVVDGYVRRSAITDEILKAFQDALPGAFVTKEGIFDFVYGALHSTGYRAKYENELRKALPRLPIPGTQAAWNAYRDAGRKLAEIHLKYEDATPYPDVQIVVDDAASGLDDKEIFRVQKMKLVKGKKESGLSGESKTIIYNKYVAIRGIPARAFDYVVNGRSPIEWIIERYQVKTDKDSGIVNDPNDWNPKNPRYIVDLIARLATVSVETLAVMESLPKWTDASAKS